MDNSLTDLPNIGNELAERLKVVGISDSHELRVAGSKNAFIKLKTVDPGV